MEESKRPISTKVLRALEQNVNSKITRAVLRKEGILLPENITSLEEAKNFIANNSSVKVPAETTPSTVARTLTNRSFNIEYNFSEYEIGTAHYRCVTNSRGIASVNEERIRELLDEHDGDIDSVVEALEEQLSSVAEDRRDSYNSENYEYENHSADNNEDLEHENGDEVNNTLTRIVSDVYTDYLEGREADEEEEEDDDGDEEDWDEDNDDT